MPLERIQPAGPVGSIGLQPLIQFHQRLRAKPVHPPLGIATDVHQTRVAQNLQMARDTRLVHPHSVHQVTDRALAVPNRIEDPPAGRFSDHVQDVESGGHLMNIRQDIYMDKCMYAPTVASRGNV